MVKCQPETCPLYAYKTDLHFNLFWRETCLCYANECRGPSIEEPGVLNILLLGSRELQNAPSNTFDLHKAIIGLENQDSVFLKLAVLHRFYCTWTIPARVA